MLAGLGISGDRFFYVNPLESTDDHHRHSWFDVSCCPPNLARTIAAVGGFAYASRGDTLVVNQNIGGSVSTQLRSGRFSMTVETEYPWRDHVTFKVEEASMLSKLALRSPGWCKDVRVTRMKRPVTTQLQNGYLQMSVKPGDVITLTMKMPVQRLRADPRVADAVGKVALARGPLIYCIEQSDHEAPLMNMQLTQTPLAAKWAQDVVGGCMVLEGHGQVASGKAGEPLYGASSARRQGSPQQLTAIPYHLWDQRSAGPMRVWIPTV